MGMFVTQKERKMRKSKAFMLRQIILDRFGAWNKMLHEVKKEITITENTEYDATQKAEEEMERLYETHSNKRKCIWPGAENRLGCLRGHPVKEVKKTVNEGIVTATAKIMYTQYELKPGFSEEEYEKAIAAYDEVEAEYMIFEEECRSLGIEL